MTPRPSGGGDLPALGLVGTAVLDCIHPWATEDGPADPVRSFGGAFYALHAMAALAPDPSQIVPVLRLGADAAAFVRAGLAALGVDTRFLVRSPARQNAVELRYTDADHRHEVLRGGVPPLRLADLAPVLPELDALYVNFVAGNELSLATLRALRRAFPRPLYGDLHSLLLARSPSGLRRPRTLPRWREWVGCFDVVQCNADEAAMLWRSRGSGAGPGGGAPRPLAQRQVERLARDVLDSGPRLFVVTAGGAPVRAWSAAGGAWRFVPRREAPARDPTGCGDVLGASFCTLRFLRGVPERRALSRAVELAARAATRIGTEGLAGDLRAWNARLTAGRRPARAADGG